MTLKPCEFEEAEYRSPLFNQLHSSTLLWEPGQVFERHIGIDHAMWTTHAYLHSLYGYGAPLEGVVLNRYRFDYIWSERRARKKLPSFRLNLFIQAKRPQYGRYVPKAFRAQGLKSPYWRFEITPHQQEALEKLNDKLKGRAIVCYACPAFHQQAKLYKWTVEPRIVENSTFPDVSLLSGHTAWNFSEPGAHGVANTDPVARRSSPLTERIRSIVETTDNVGESPEESLQILSRAVRAVMEDESSDSLARARFAEGSRGIRSIVEGSEREPDRVSISLAYGEVLLFCYLYRLNWSVIG